MNDDEFRKALEAEIKKDNLQGVKDLFENAPKDFDINYRDLESHNTFDTHLMQCLKYGASLEIFKFLESKGATIDQSISAKDNSIDGQNVPFNINKKQEIVFESRHIEYYVKNSGNENLKQKYQNAHNILNYIDKKSDIAQKNKIGLVALSAYYLDKKLFTELVADQNIDVNVTAGREANIAKIIIFDKVRDNLFEEAFKRQDLVIDFDTVVQTALFEDHNLFKKLIDRVDDNSRYELVDKMMTQVRTLSVREDCIQKIDTLLEKCPKEIRAYLQSDKCLQLEAGLKRDKEYIPNGFQTLYNIRDKVATEDKEAIVTKVNEEIISLVDKFAQSNIDSNQQNLDANNLKKFGQEVVDIIKQSSPADTKQVLAQYVKEDKNGKSKLDADISKVEPELKIKDKLFDIASNIVKSLGFAKLSEAIRQNISQEGQSSIKAMAAIKQQIKDNMINISSKENNNISQEGQSSIAAIAAIKQQIKENTTNTSPKSKTTESTNVGNTKPSTPGH